VQDVDVVIAGRQPVCDGPGAVGAVVVGDQDVGLRDGVADPPHDERQILTLVVGGDDDENATERVPGLRRTHDALLDS
jgi:hypothetical protein